MKKSIFLFAIFVGVAVSVSSAFIEDKIESVSTVSEALKMKDDRMVTVQGHITKQIKKDTYLFSDSTGEITVEIDEKDWKGVDVRPSDTVQLFGEIDKDWTKTEIDVVSVKLIQ